MQTLCATGCCICVPLAIPGPALLGAWLQVEASGSSRTRAIPAACASGWAAAPVADGWLALEPDPSFDMLCRCVSRPPSSPAKEHKVDQLKPKEYEQIG